MSKITRNQRTAYVSSWGKSTLLARVLWQVVWLLLFRPTPKFLSPWRILLLRLFGARIDGRPFVSASCRIAMPWLLKMEHRACLGEEVVVYNLGRVILRERCTVAQRVYLCGGSHDVSTPRLPLLTGDIEVGADVFIGAAAFILPGVRIGDGAVVGAASVVTKDMPEWMICAGNPCRPIKTRPWNPEG